MMALLIGGIVIMSLMSIAVPERRREIGVRRSVGAARGDSVQQFLLEAVLVALAGGLAGVLMGWGGMQIVTRYPDRGRCPLNFFLRWFGCSALVVSGLGMLSITWITVKERTREFGTRRALEQPHPAFFFTCCRSARRWLWPAVHWALRLRGRFRERSVKRQGWALCSVERLPQALLLPHLS